MKTHFIIVLAGVILISGCSGSGIYGTRPDEIQPRAKTQPVPIEKPVYTPGSLWPGENNRNMLFSDNKARYVNDIVTIVIDESSSGKNQASTNTSKDTKTNAGISALLGIDTSITKSNANMGGGISVGGTSANSLKGSGDTSRGGTRRPA